MKTKDNISLRNNKASFDYFLLDTYDAGIILTGTEIKSVRQGRVNLNDSYCTFKGNEMFVIGMHVSEYENASFKKHDPKRDRKLLLTSRELKKLKVQVQEKGLTIVPVRLYVNDRGLAKLEIALAKGKHTYDKKESIKEKDLKRELDRE